MTVKITEVTKEDRATFGMRLQTLRENMALSRRELAEQTGIPMKSIEKFETGLMSPNIDRLQELARVLETPVSYMLDGEQPELPRQDTPAEPVENHAEAVEDTEDVQDEFLVLDEMREEGFQNYWRSAPRIIDTLRLRIDGLSYEELLDIAEERALMAIPESEIKRFDTLELEDQAMTLGALKERIIDTAYFGVDLFKLKMEPLIRLAEKQKLEGDVKGWASDNWSSQAVLVAALRPQVRELAMKGSSPDFHDENSFPKTKTA